MISTPGHWASRRRQRGALPAWSLRIVIGARCFLARSRGIAYLRTTDLFGRADFLLPTLLGGLRASLTVFPAWNRTALLAGILILSPVCGFRPSRAGRAATLKVPRPDTRIREVDRAQLKARIRAPGACTGSRHQRGAQRP